MAEPNNYGVPSGEPRRPGWAGLLAVGVTVACLVAQGFVLVRVSAVEAGLERIAMRTELAPSGRRATSDSASGVRPQVQLNACSGPSAEELRNIVREELADLESRSAQRGAALDADDAALADHDPVENDAAFVRANRLVDGAIAARFWGEAQALELRQLRSKLTAEQISELNSKLIPAINRQELRVDATMPF